MNDCGDEHSRLSSLVGSVASDDKMCERLPLKFRHSRNDYGDLA